MDGPLCMEPPLRHHKEKAPLREVSARIVLRCRFKFRDALHEKETRRTGA